MTRFNATLSRITGEIILNVNKNSFPMGFV